MVKRAVSVVLDDEHIERVMEIGQLHGVSRSECISRLIDYFKRVDSAVQKYVAAYDAENVKEGDNFPLFELGHEILDVLYAGELGLTPSVDDAMRIQKYLELGPEDPPKSRKKGGRG